MSELTKNALFNYFGGHATPLQKKLIEEWMHQDKNVELYYEWLEEWEREHPQFLPDTEEALHRYLRRIHENETSVVLYPENPRQSRHSWKTGMKFAASVSILILFAFFLYIKRDFIEYRSYRTEFGELRTLILEDGSQVTLNANSLLRIPRFGFGKDKREVFLKGEAEFIVEQIAGGKKFLVHTPDQLEVEVVGTEFIVFSRERGSKVVLNKGKILLRSLNDNVEPLAVKSGDVVTIQNGVFDVREKQPVELHAAWKDRRFIFDRTSMTEVALQLEERLDLKLVIADSALAKRELTGTVEAENAEEFLDVLSKLLDVRIQRDGKNVILGSRAL